MVKSSMEDGHDYKILPEVGAGVHFDLMNARGGLAVGEFELSTVLWLSSFCLVQRLSSLFSCPKSRKHSQKRACLAQQRLSIDLSRVVA